MAIRQVICVRIVVLSLAEEAIVARALGSGATACKPSSVPFVVAEGRQVCRYALQRLEILLARLSSWTSRRDEWAPRAHQRLRSAGIERLRTGLELRRDGAGCLHRLRGARRRNPGAPRLRRKPVKLSRRWLVVSAAHAPAQSRIAIAVLNWSKVVLHHWTELMRIVASVFRQICRRIILLQGRHAISEWLLCILPRRQRLIGRVRD